MIHGYHLILPMYGFWLPNDPRGTWSDFVWNWELARFGTATKSHARRQIQELSEEELTRRQQAINSLKYSAVWLNGHQALSVAQGFAFRSRSSRYTVWACAVLPEHTHLVLARHKYSVEQMAKLLKAAATTQMSRDDCHPFKNEICEQGSTPSMWAESHWKVYLDSEEQIETAIRYVEQNPEREGKRAQRWSFVEPFRGLESGHITYH